MNGSTILFAVSTFCVEIPLKSIGSDAWEVVQLVLQLRDVLMASYWLVCQSFAFILAVLSCFCVPPDKQQMLFISDFHSKQSNLEYQQKYLHCFPPARGHRLKSCRCRY